MPSTGIVRRGDDLRVLVVHNRYSSRVPSGENVMVDEEVGWLREAGVDVELLVADNDDLVADTGVAARARQAISTPWSLPAARRLRAAIDRFVPDVVHLHNVFPLLSPSVIRAAVGADLPVVWTVHNYRVRCVIGTWFRDGAPCHACRPGWRAPGIRHSCYGGSPVASGLVTAASTIFRRLARRRCHAVAVSDAVRGWLVSSAGFPAERVHLKHNAVAAPDDGEPGGDAVGCRDVLFAGYLIDYKGIGLLLDAWRRADVPDGVRLVIAGDGPMAPDVRAAQVTDERIAFVGQLPAGDAARQVGRARVVVVPSIWDEPFGRSAAEAFARGRPVITTGLGGLGEIVDDRTGWVTGTNPDAMARALAEATRSDAAVAPRAAAAAERYQTHFSPTASTDRLLEIYDEVLDGR